MIRAVIIDDEENNVTNLRRLLENYCPGVEIAGTALNAENGAELIQLSRPDLVFLDIRMPGQSGFDLLRQIEKPAFEIIFVTAYDQYGIQAVKFAAMDYLLKPIDIGELQQAVEKATSRIASKNHDYQLQYLTAILEQGHKKEEHRIALPALRETRFVFTKDIVRCESSNSYTHVFMADGERITVSVSLLEYEEMLTPYGFVRCHQSHLVNKQFVKSLVKESGSYLLLQDGTQVPVSRQKREGLKNHLL